jgi:nucleoside-triphosphatase
MANNYFITGLPKAGKTTLLRKIAERLKKERIKVSGFFTPEESAQGTRTGFMVEDINSNKKALLAAVGIKGPKVAKYHVDIKGFESIALSALKKGEESEVIIVDEIGKMEMKSSRFAIELKKVLDSGKPLIASIHRDFMEEYGKYGEIMLLTESNREAVYSELINKIIGTIKDSKGQKKEIRAIGDPVTTVSKFTEFTYIENPQSRDSKEKMLKSSSKKVEETDKQKNKKKIIEEFRTKDWENTKEEEKNEEQDLVYRKKKSGGILGLLEELWGFW